MQGNYIVSQFNKSKSFRELNDLKLSLKKDMAILLSCSEIDDEKKMYCDAKTKENESIKRMFNLFNQLSDEEKFRYMKELTKR